LAHNGTIVYKYGASDASQWHLKPNHLLFWRVIERGCVDGFRRLDFGRSDAESQGLRQFKAGWGAVEVPLHYSRLGRGRPAAAGAASLLPSAALDRGAAIPDLLEMTLGEGQFGPEHWRLSRARRIYYRLKPLLPRKAIGALRRMQRRALETDDHGLGWPVEDR